MHLDFKGKRVVVCGGSRGIGRAIALGFAEAGAAVSTCARGADALEAVRTDLARFGGKVHTATCDLAKANDISRYIPAAAENLGGIDVLINNASGFYSKDALRVTLRRRFTEKDPYFSQISQFWSSGLRRVFLEVPDVPWS
jgi:3-oxoacyl-[acyl-carrier protein] reductase